MKRFVGKTSLALLVLISLGLLSAATPPEQDWTHYVRIGGYGLKSDNAEEIVRKAKESNVFGIEVDNDIPGRYESFLHPEEKLKAIRAVAQANGQNPIAILIPCHRVINSDGKLGGYGGGLLRKQFLLDLERGDRLL